MFFAFVDALRGYAILLVILVHTSLLVKGLPGWLYSIAANGARGVQLFYIVSAFTLFYSLKYNHKSETNKVLNFYLRRFFRVLPGFPWVADLLMSFPEGTNEGYGPIFSDSRADRALVC